MFDDLQYKPGLLRNLSLNKTIWISPAVIAVATGIIHLEGVDVGRIVLVMSVVYVSANTLE
jgi:hypothetical protein